MSMSYPRGTRVKVSAYGEGMIRRYARSSKTGVVTGPGLFGSILVQWDGTKRGTSVHESYVEPMEQS